MEQTVAFNSYTDISLTDAIGFAKASFPDENFVGIQNSADLEAYINNIGQTLFVSIDTAKQSDTAIQASNNLKTQIDEDLKTINCHLPPATFSQDDVPDDLCEIPPEFPPEIQIPDNEISDLEKQLADIGVDAQGKIDDVLKCTDSMSTITSQIDTLNKKATDVKNTLINLEELLYNYRVTGSYYQKRVDTLNQLLGTFDPLIQGKKDLQSQIDNITPLDTKAKTDLDNATAQFKAGKETQANLNKYQSTYNSIHAQLTSVQTQFNDVQNKISFKEAGISPILQEINLESSSTFQGLGASDKEIARLQWLQGNLGGSNTSTIQNVGTFTSRTVITPSTSTSSPNSYSLIIQHTMKDDSNVLAGRPKSYASSSDTVTIIPAAGTPSGVLYDQLYNIWGDIEKFFTREERGLTSNSSFVDPSLKNTGAETFNGNFIESSTKFENFYKNFPANHANKVTQVKNTIIEPALSAVVGDLENLAINEVQYLFAYGRGFETLPADSTQLTDVINSILNASQVYLAKLTELQNDYMFLQKTYDDIQTQIEAKKQEYLATPCAKPEISFREAPPVPPGQDPLGVDTIQQIFPQDPEPTKFCYWVKFSAMATAVNVLPIPGPGGFRYWPVGLIIPTPAGTINIPLPIIWIPISVIVIPVGIFVVFIGQCGICPSPFVLYIGPNGEKNFIISLRPTQEFGTNASAGVIKTLEKGGFAINTKVSDMLNKIKVPSFKPLTNPDGASSLLSDLKDKILKKVNKIGSPDITPITSRLTTHSTIDEKKKVLKEVVSKHMEKLTLPTIKIPKNSFKTNPKPLPTVELINDLTKLAKMKLPQIAIPTSNIDIKDKLISKINNINPNLLNPVNVPPFDFNKATPAESEAHSNKIKNALKDGLRVAHKSITAKDLGIAIAVLGGGVVFINPYKCKPGTKGLGVPPLPGAAIVALAAILVAAEALIDGLTLAQIKELMKGIFTLTKNMIPAMLAGILKALPSFPIPDPSNISIKDLLKDSMLKLAKVQMPSLPNGIPQIQIPLPGEALKSAIIKGVDAAINVFPLTDVDLTKLSAVDIKQIIITMVETSFTPVELFLNPFLNIISAYGDAKDKSFAETLGLKKLNLDHSSTPVITEASMAAAMTLLKLLSKTPYPAVAVAPQAFKQLHPLLVADDIPPWQRLSLENFLFVVFLDQFCSQGKKGGGLLEFP